MYEEFAEFYDSLTDDVGYEKRTKYLCSLFSKFDRMPTLLLDAACGTGGFSNEFAGLGVSVIGVDMSCQMLSVATQKSKDLGLDVLYLCQDLTELDLYGTVDGAICCLDSLNHITDYTDFKKAISRISLFLEKDRLFIFDVNTDYKHKYVLSNNTFVIENDELYCVWQNEYNGEERTVDISLDIFKNCGGKYTRNSEYITERAYNSEEIESALKKAGLKVEAVFGDMTNTAPKETEERIIYVTRKV